MSRLFRRPPNRTVRRVVEGVRVAFVYSYRKLDVSVTPDPDDLRQCPPASLLRFWAAVAAWAAAVPRTNPGWTVNGERPDPPPDEADDHGEGQEGANG